MTERSVPESFFGILRSREGPKVCGIVDAEVVDDLIAVDNSALVYITVTQDLLQEASERFRVVGAPCLNLMREARP